MKASSLVDHRPKYSKILFRQISRILGEDVQFSDGTQNKSGKVLGDSFAMIKLPLSPLTDFFVLLAFNFWTYRKSTSNTTNQMGQNSLCEDDMRLVSTNSAEIKSTDQEKALLSKFKLTFNLKK